MQTSMTPQTKIMEHTSDPWRPTDDSVPSAHTAKVQGIRGPSDTSCCSFGIFLGLFRLGVIRGLGQSVASLLHSLGTMLRGASSVLGHEAGDNPMFFRYQVGECPLLRDVSVLEASDEGRFGQTIYLIRREDRRAAFKQTAWTKECGKHMRLCRRVQS